MRNLDEAGIKTFLIKNECDAQILDEWPRMSSNLLLRGELE